MEFQEVKSDAEFMAFQYLSDCQYQIYGYWDNRFQKLYEHITLPRLLKVELTRITESQIHLPDYSEKRIYHTFELTVPSLDEDVYVGTLDIITSAMGAFQEASWEINLAQCESVLGGLYVYSSEEHTTSTSDCSVPGL